MINVLIYYNDIFINRIYCDRYDNEGSLKNLILFIEDNSITSFPLSRVGKFELTSAKYNEYTLNIVDIH